MDRAKFEAAAPRRPSTTRVTDAATFTITALDVGSQAVRPGCMAELEQERELLLQAAKLTLSRIRSGRNPIGATYEFVLDAAIRMVEARTK